MSKIAEYRALEAQIGEQLKRLEALKADSALKKEIEFEQKLKALLEKYDMSLKDIIGIFEPDAGGNARKGAAPTAKISRRERIVKRYKNPSNGEIVETKGGNHKVLKAWKKEYGNDTVESWRQ
ncbi:transcriptional regulator [Pseudomonadaceae bacterium SI-3]|nr:transcriptional regulator [Pseudomonadaceae bacterium SI-3]